MKVPDGSAKSYLANRGPVYFLFFLLEVVEKQTLQSQAGLLEI